MKRYIILIPICLMAVTAQAASLEFQPQYQTFVVGTPLTVTVYLDPQGQSVNAVQGQIDFSSTQLALERVYNGNSIIGLWLTRPTEKTAGTIAWSGIIPGGFDGILQAGNTALLPGQLFTMVFRPIASGTATISFNHLDVLLNDGQGTPAQVSARSLTVMSASTAPDMAIPTVITNDHNPPDPFVVTVSHDPNIFNDRWFAVWNATDKETGVAAYGIFESTGPSKAIDEAAWHPANSPYLLQDQSLQSYIYVRAIDQAGNTRVAVSAPTNPAVSHLETVGWFVIIIVVGGLGLWLFRRKED